MKHLSLLLPLLALLVSCTPRQESASNLHDFISGVESQQTPGYPAEYRPWTRWWWLGNIVDTAGITAELEAFAEAGIGGVEITPLYGVRGYEDQFIDHLSPRWQEMLSHTITVAGRLGLGVDMNLGTGWPFGGPHVEREYAAGILEYELDPVSGSYLISCGKTGQQVKRAAPGGEGYSLDHFSREALDDYLEPYNTAITTPGKGLRALFNDSYEVYGANYTPDFPDEFSRRRNYDLTDHLPGLLGRNDSTLYSRLLCDYRETLSDLILESFAMPWNRWSEERSFITRYQAHGSPGNLVDLYASAGIPECEIFGAPRFDIPGYHRDQLEVREGDDDPMMQKFCSSAAHLQGSELVSAESFTWLREHFNTALSHCKPVADELFLNGVTHIFLHGSTYSPENEPWPGFKFYASVNFHPANSIWHDAPYLFNYIRRCQHILQQTKTDNQVLLYWPFHDVLSAAGRENLLLQLSVHNVDEWLTGTSFYRLAGVLDSLGIGYDVVSDRFLEEADFRNGKIAIGGKSEYDVIVVPELKVMPLKTLERLTGLVSGGASVLFAGYPQTVPGYHRFGEREKQLKQLLADHSPSRVPVESIGLAMKSEGVVAEEDAAASSLKMLKKWRNGKAVYFLANHTDQTIDRWVTFRSTGEEALLFDPMTGEYGAAKTRFHRDSTEVRLHMFPGETRFLFMDDAQHITEAWSYPAAEETAGVKFNSWHVGFLLGGPELPGPLVMERPGPWTGHGDAYDAFAGTAVYATTFTLEDSTMREHEGLVLELDDVRESARIRLNGKLAGVLIAHPFRLDISEFVQPGENTLEIEVTSVSSNRIRALELSGREWKKFYDINMVDIHYRPFDASSWPVAPAGLNGEVKMLRVKQF